VQQLDDDADTREDVDQGARSGVKILATPAVRLVHPDILEDKADLYKICAGVFWSKTHIPTSD
jgi:hypothetical protein